LSWSSASQAKQIVPQSCLYPATGAGTTGLVTINGQASFATIQEAADAALPGDTVELQPLRYNVPAGITLKPGVTLKGVSPNRTILDGQGAGVVVHCAGTVADGRLVLEGFAVTGGVIGIDTGEADVLLKNLVVAKNGGDGVWVGTGSLVEGVSLTVADNGGEGIAINSTTAAFRNIVVTGNAGTGISGPPEATVHFSTFYGNGLGTAAGGINAEGAGILLLPVTFDDSAALDYRETAASPSIDTGDPADASNLEPSPNGGRINQGAFGNTADATTSSSASATGSPTAGKSSGGGCGLLGVELLLLLGWRRTRRS
jgi:hypothetical protein